MENGFLENWILAFRILVSSFLDKFLLFVAFRLTVIYSLLIYHVGMHFAFNMFSFIIRQC